MEGFEVFSLLSLDRQLPAGCSIRAWAGLLSQDYIKEGRHDHRHMLSALRNQASRKATMGSMRVALRAGM